jgi:hypothetical protein
MEIMIMICKKSRVVLAVCFVVHMVFTTYVEGGTALPTGQPREWTYAHYAIRDQGGTERAQFSRIYTVNAAGELLTIDRILFEDSAHRRLVIRNQAGDIDVTRLSFKFVPTHELVRIEKSRSSPTVTVTFGECTLQLTDGQPIDRQQADLLLGHASQEFRASLREFTSIGLQTYHGFRGQAKYLRALFFPDIATSVDGLELEHNAQLTRRIDGFRPDGAPRSEFDGKFGADYDQ